MKTALITAALLLLGYSALVAYAPRPDEPRFQSQWHDSRYKLGKYLRTSPKPQVVLVGSSLTAALGAMKDERCFYNMALAGGSALTGLETIARSDDRPREVFIEINVPERAADEPLIDSASSFLARRFPLFYTENMPANLTVSALYGLFGKGQAGTGRAMPPGALEVQRQNYDTLVAPAVLGKRLARFKVLVDDLQRHGSRAVFFEMPVEPALEDTARARQIREQFKTAFPGAAFITFQDLARGLAVRTSDGVHVVPAIAEKLTVNLQSYGWQFAACAGSL